MKISTRTRYGIRAMFELAANYGAEPLQIRIIAKRQNISVKYLEQLMAILKSAGFVRSIRGARGGYLLAKPPSKININELFSALEGPVVTVECVENESYGAKVADCIARVLWVQVQEAIQSTLQSVTLQDLVDRARDQVALDYQI